MAAQTDAPSSDFSAETVGNAFVGQFYKILHQSPELVYRFYQDSSTMSRPGPDGALATVTAMEGIKGLILSLDCTDYKVEILTADAQASYMNGVIVLVTGCLTGKDNVRRNFTESFFLAPQNKGGFFVLNDTFRFIEEDSTPEVNSVEEKDVDKSAPASPVVPVEDTIETSNVTVNHAPVAEDVTKTISISEDEPKLTVTEKAVPQASVDSGLKVQPVAETLSNGHVDARRTEFQKLKKERNSEKRREKFANSVTMDPKLTEIAQTFERFKAASVRNDFDTSTRLLSQLKVSLTEFRSLPPLFEATPNAIHELSLARDIYEHAVVLSVKMEDQEAFERDFCQLKPYYTDARGHIPQSPQEYPILGLNLLRLLVQNRIAEFHTELELLSSTALDNPCIKHAVELEQSFMEGAYNRVLSARQSVPHETYVHFMDLLAKTVRDEIAGCSEKAYDSLSLNDTKQLLLFSSDKDLLEYINEEHPDWEIKDGCVYFQKAKESAPCKEIPSLLLINQTLSYARELERIV